MLMNISFVDLPFNERHALGQTLRNWTHERDKHSYRVYVYKSSTLTRYLVLDPPDTIKDTLTRMGKRYQTSLVFSPETSIPDYL